MKNKKITPGPGVLKKIARKLDICIERCMGYDFLSVVDVKQLGLDPELVVRGSPSGNRYLRNILDGLRITESDVILDIGCAKGSALKQFLLYPFNRIIGIELSSYYAEIAKKNFNKIGDDRVTIKNIDATLYDGYELANIFYLYNPFPESVANVVFSAIKCAIKDNEIVIIYNNPVCHKSLISNGFHKISEYPDEWGNGIFIYSSNKYSNRIK